MNSARCEVVNSRGHALDAGLLRQDEVDLGAGAVHLDALDRAPELLGQRGGVDQREERPLRIGVGQHDARLEARAVLQLDAARAPVAHVDPGDRSGGPDLRAELPGRGRHRLRDRPHPAQDVAVEALELVLASREEVKEKPERRAGRIGPAVLAVDVVGQEERLDLLGLVVAVQKIAQASGQKRDHPADLVARDSAKPPADPQRLEQSGETAGVHVRRRLQEEGLEVARQLLELVVHPDERARVGGESFESSRTVRSRSDHHGATVPSGNGTSRAGSQGTMRSPCRARLRSRMTSGRSMLAM